MFKYLLILIIFCGCANYYSVNHELESYVSEFKIEAKKYGHDLVIDDLIMDYDISNPKLLGACRKRENSPIVITVNTNHNCTYDYSNLLFITFHELSHAYLDRRHKDGYDDSDNQISIMNSEACCTDCKEMLARKTKEYYMKELFTN